MNIVPKFLNIVTYPNKILRQPSVNIDTIKSSRIQQLITDMVYTMKSAQGIGLAAPQVGHNLNIFVVDDGSGPHVYINPHILFRSRKNILLEEGCLSIPEVYGMVSRPEAVWLIYRNRHGHLKFRRRTAMLSRIIQHEYDHLQGVLFIDKIEKITSGQDKLAEYESKR